MWEGQILTLVISSICALFGGVILLAGFIRKNHWLKIIGGAFALAGIVSLFVNNEDFRAILTAAAGVIAAVAVTFALQQNTQLRKDAKERELRDRTEKSLNEIIDWAADVLTSKSPIENLRPEWMLETKLDSEEKMRFIQIYMNLDLLSQYAVLQQHGKYISLLASTLPVDLSEAVDAVLGRIEKHVELLFEGAQHTSNLDEYGTVLDIFVKGKTELRDGLSEGARKQLAILDDRKELNNSAENVISLAVKIKASTEPE